MEGVGSQLVAGAPAGSEGPIHRVTDPSAFRARRPEVSCCDPNCDTGCTAPHHRSPLPGCRSTTGPGVPSGPCSGTPPPACPPDGVGDTSCCHVDETENV